MSDVHTAMPGTHDNCTPGEDPWKHWEEHTVLGSAIKRIEESGKENVSASVARFDSAF